MALPFFVSAGMAVSFALTRSPFKVALVYGVDVSGAASGSPLAITTGRLQEARSAWFM